MTTAKLLSKNPTNPKSVVLLQLYQSSSPPQKGKGETTAKSTSNVDMLVDDLSAPNVSASKTTDDNS